MTAIITPLHPEERGSEEMPPVMSPQQLADHFSVSVKTVERWRESGEGPEPFKLPGGRMWRYHRDEVTEWLDGLRNKEPGVAAPGSRITE